MILRLLASPIIKYLAISVALAGLTTGAIAVANDYFTTKQRLKSAIDEKAELTLQLLQKNIDIANLTSLYEKQLKRNNDLHRHFDNIRSRLREANDKQTQEWRNTPVPGPVVDGLRDHATPPNL